MKKVLKSYKKTIVLLVMVILGVICGLIFKEKMNIIKPLGDLFLNLYLNLLYFKFILPSLRAAALRAGPFRGRCGR